MTLIKKLGQIVEIIGLLIPASDHTVLKEYLHILTAESVNGIAFVPAKWKRLIENARLNAIEIAR